MTSLTLSCCCDRGTDIFYYVEGIAHFPKPSFKHRNREHAINGQVFTEYLFKQTSVTDIISWFAVTIQNMIENSSSVSNGALVMFRVGL